GGGSRRWLARVRGGAALGRAAAVLSCSRARGVERACAAPAHVGRGGGIWGLTPRAARCQTPLSDRTNRTGARPRPGPGPDFLESSFRRFVVPLRCNETSRARRAGQ